MTLASQYVTNEIISSYLLACYKKDISISNLSNTLELVNRYVDLERTTCEDILGIVAAIHLRLFKLTNDSFYLYSAINFYRRGSYYESGNIYCARNYCSTLLKIYLIENNTEILKEYYYSAVHNAKVFLTQAQTLQRKNDEYNNIWFQSNQSDLLLISNYSIGFPFHSGKMTQRQKTTITLGREDLKTDLDIIRSKIGL